MEVPDTTAPTFCTQDELAYVVRQLRQCSLDRRRTESSVTLLQYFGFQEDTIRDSPDPRCLYLSRTHREALAVAGNGFLNNRGFTAMIAPPGMGKTTLLYRFLEDTRETARTCISLRYRCRVRTARFCRLHPARHRHHSRAEQFSDARTINRGCDQRESGGTEIRGRDRRGAEPVGCRAGKSSPAHQLRNVAGQADANRPLRTAAVSDKLMQSSLVQLRQRISTVCRLEPLSAEETVAYIDYRLKLAGYEGEPLFTEDALKLITEASQGTPRTINNLCFNALSLCCALKSKQVDGSMVSKVNADLQLVPQSREPIAAVSERCG